MFTFRNLVKAVFVIVVICAFQIWFIYHFNEKAAREAAHRISILWPDLSIMPQEDRVLIDHAAYHCNIHKEYPLPGAVKNCLRVGAMKMDALHPEPQSLRRLETLLADAR